MCRGRRGREENTLEKILFLTCTENGVLPKAALEALGSAVELKSALGASLALGLIGESTREAADAIAACGADKFFAVTGADFAQSRYVTDAAAAEAICRAAEPTIVVAASGTRTSRAVPGVAFRLGGRIDTHISAVAPDGGKLSVTRWFYRQRMEGAFTRAHRPWFLLLDSGCHGAWIGAAASASVEEVAVSVSPRTTVEGIVTPPTGQQTIRPDAKLLFVAGAGWTKKQKDGQQHAPEAETLILDFLAHSQASLGGSKSLVDLSGEGQAVLKFMTHLNQVGQTGATPRHPKGLSTCCHGEEPHVVGWRFVNERRAVNLDPNCGWARGKADVLYVADAFEVMRKLNALLESKMLAAAK
jgi:electron transfer flavoprotein alpha subunit